MGHSCRDVAKNLNVDPSIASRIVSRFDETGSVNPTDRKGVKGVHQAAKVLHPARVMHETSNMLLSARFHFKTF